MPICTTSFAGEWSTARRWERQRPAYYTIARRAVSICRLLAAFFIFIVLSVR